MSTHIWFHEQMNTVEYPTSNLYYGELSDGRRHGFGFMLYNRGGNYEGYWKRGKKHGTGTRVYNTGDVYRGNFRKGLRHGKGECRWKGDDTFYDLRWNRNEIVEKQNTHA